MSRHCFPIFGALVLLMGPASVEIMFERTPTLTQGLRWLVLMVAVEMVGFGLACLRKWAALYFSVPLFFIGIQKALVSIHESAFPLNLLAMLYGLAFTLPSLLTIRLWKQLTWGRRFF